MLPPNGVRIPDLAIVNPFLERLGLGKLSPDRVVTHPGRHRKCSGVTTSGRGVFVKQLNESLGCPAPGVRRARSFEALRTPELSGAALLGADDDRNLLVFELIEDAEPADLLAREGRFDAGLARCLGEMTGALHELPVDLENASIDTSPSRYPPLGSLEGLTLTQYQAASSAVLQGWRLLQQDEEVKEALRALRRDEDTASKVPTHGDFRLDQVLVVGGRRHIIDWEEFRLGDPAHDVGMFVGEWLYLAADRAARGLHTGPVGDSGTVLGVSREEVIARTTVELRAVQPMVGEFWSGYRSVRTTTDPDLPRRSAAFAGWHLYDRMFSVVAKMMVLSMTQYVANGIGRRALLNPHEIAGILEMGEIDVTSR
ncbi:class V lanthionine synthetase subunit LxmK [Streptomyces lincolnensis]|nr:class V lanthionine synthetase subunit LxmK [Streptomyces lincolnensis]QMV11649.1 phosphotransferase [Streptomyces lincolnensis]